MPKIISAAVQQGKLLVLDADGLNLLTKHKLLLNYTRAILTPNIVEFKRLWASYIGGDIAVSTVALPVNEEINIIETPHEVSELARAMGNTIMLKGPSDIISDGTLTLGVSSNSSAKRTGGIGDVLSGCTATLAHLSSSKQIPLTHSAATAALLIRKASSQAFTQKAWSLTAVDVLNSLPGALAEFLNPL